MKDMNSILAEKFKNKNFEKSYHRTATFYRLADELLFLRKKRGLSQKELAKKAGTTQTVVSRLENASVKASLESVVKFADALDAFVDVQLIPLEEKKSELIDMDSSIFETKGGKGDANIIYDSEFLQTRYKDLEYVRENEKMIENWFSFPTSQFRDRVFSGSHLSNKK